jgi:monoterpene epsilon-lactone hydrolase
MSSAARQQNDARAYEHRIPLQADDREAERALLQKFAEFWSNTKADLRTTYDTFVAATPLAPNVTFDDVQGSARDVRGSWCRPGETNREHAILYLHGGMYGLGSAHAYRGLASQVAARAGLATFVLDHPLAPEHPFPAAVDSAAATLAWLAAQGIRQVALVGDSSGGGLSLVTASAKRVEPAIVGCAVFSPWTDLALAGSTFHEPEFEDTLLTREALAGSAKAYAGSTDPRDPRVSPLYDVPRDLPPVYIQVGTRELLLDDARRYAARAASQGVRVQLDIWEELHHVFQLNVNELASSRRALDLAAEFIRARFN